MRTLVFAASLLAGVLLAGCGYHAPGAGDQWVGSGSRTLYVEPFANHTPEPYLETILTDEIVTQFNYSRLVDLTSQRDTADLLMTGAVTSFSSSALAYNPRDNISEYRAQMTATAKLLRRSDNAVLWQGTLSRDEVFSSRDDKSQQRVGERLAARKTAERLAEDLLARLTDDF